MQVKIGDAAKSELEEAVVWYENQLNGLGYKFSFEVHETVKRISAFPKSYTIIDRKIRRALIKVFPYGLIYTINFETIEIIAVANLHRSPVYWKKRLKTR